MEAAVSTTPTVVVVSSGASYESFPEGVKLTLAEIHDPSAVVSWKSYAHSKLANVLFAQDLSSRVSDKGIVVNSCHPGLVETVVFDKSWRSDSSILQRICSTQRRPGSLEVGERRMQR